MPPSATRPSIAMCATKQRVDDALRRRMMVVVRCLVLPAPYAVYYGDAPTLVAALDAVHGFSVTVAALKWNVPYVQLASAIVAVRDIHVRHWGVRQ